MTQVTDLMSSIGSTTDDATTLQQKADKALRGKHVQSPSGLNPNAPVDFDAIYAEPQLDTVTADELRALYPVKVNDRVLERSAEIINSAVADMDFAIAKEFRDNCLGMIDILKNSKSRVTFDDYVSACKFVTFKMAGNTDIRAYSLTFPDRVRRMEREKIPNSHLYQYASIYAKNKTVVEVMSRMMTPTHILYQDIFHQAVKTQAELMVDQSVSPKVRSDAANSLMTHLKTPEIKQAEINISTKDNGVIGQLAEALVSLSSNQRNKIIEGEFTLSDVSKATIYTENGDDND